MDNNNGTTEKNVENGIYTEQPARKPMVYIKNEDAIGVREGKRHYYQCFIKDNFSTVAKTPVMAMVSSGTVDEDDMKIIEFIYVGKFTTIEQILRFCTANKIDEGKQRVSLLMGAGIITGFFLMGSGKAGSYVQKPDDARVFYCLKQGGKYILDEYSNRLFIEWEPGDNITSIKNIESQVMINEIYLDMLYSGKKMISYEPRGEFNLREDYFRCSAFYGFEDSNGINEYMIFDTIRREDNIENIRKKIRLWEGLLCTKVWMRYFNDTKKIPMLIFVVDNDELAYALAQNIATGSKLNIFLITTFDRITNRALGDPGRFIKYSKDEGQLYEITYKLFTNS